MGRPRRRRLYINDVLLDEAYLVDNAKAFGECDIDLPCQVPEGRVFVPGGHRGVPADSRSSTKEEPRWSAR